MSHQKKSSLSKSLFTIAILGVLSGCGAAIESEPGATEASDAGQPVEKAFPTTTDTSFLELFEQMAKDKIANGKGEDLAYVPPAPVEEPQPVTPVVPDVVVPDVEEQPEVVEPPVAETPVVETPVEIPVVEQPTPAPQPVKPQIPDIIVDEPEVVEIPEEPVIEEPVVETPAQPETPQKPDIIIDEPEVVETPEEPVIEEPVTEEPVIEEPVVETPTQPETPQKPDIIIDEPEVVEIPEEPVIEEPVIEEPVIQEPAQLGSVLLGWDDQFSYDSGEILATADIDSFEIVYGESPESMNQGISVTNPAAREYRLTDLGAGELYFAVRVITKSGESSPFSNPVYAAIE